MSDDERVCRYCGGEPGPAGCDDCRGTGRHPTGEELDARVEALSSEDVAAEVRGTLYVLTWYRPAAFLRRLAVEVLTLRAESARLEEEARRLRDENRRLLAGRFTVDECRLMSEAKRRGKP